MVFNLVVALIVVAYQHCDPHKPGDIKIADATQPVNAAARTLLRFPIERPPA